MIASQHYVKMNELTWSVLGSCTGLGIENTRVTSANLHEIYGRAGGNNAVATYAGGAISNSWTRLKVQKAFLQRLYAEVAGKHGRGRGWTFRDSLLDRDTRRRYFLVNSIHEDDYGDSNDESLPPALDEVLDYLSVSETAFPVIADDSFQIPEARKGPESGVQEGYLGLFIRLLGLDNPVEDREEAVQALWSHSAGGKEFINQILDFKGCLSLVVNLLSSDRPASSAAAAGLLRNISSVSEYQSAVAEAGALEEIAGLLTRRSISPEVKEQAAHVLWNLSADEGSSKILYESEMLQVLLNMLGSETVGEREAAAGVVSHLTRSSAHHEILIRAGILPRLARTLLNDTEESKVVRQEVRKALLELARDQHIKLLIIEEGLVPVPQIGATAYRSFKPLLQVAPPLPENVKTKPLTSRLESKFGAGELLLGLKVESTEIDDVARMNIEGRNRQQFLARIGVLEKKTTRSDQSLDERITLLPWWDGIPRLILVLGLDDVAAATQAALAIADISITEENRNAVHKGGAVPHLVRLLGSGDEDATAAAAFALEKLSISPQIRRSINAHEAPSALVAILNAEDGPEFVKEKVVGALLQLSKSGKEVDAIIQAGAIPGLVDIVDSDDATVEAKVEAEEILEEMSGLKSDQRNKIIAAGALRPLLDMMLSGTPGQAEMAACVLENLVTEGSNAAAIMHAGAEPALIFLLNIDFQDGLAEMKNGKAISSEDGYKLVGAASRLLEKVARYERINALLFAPVLMDVLQVDDVPMKTKDWVSACLLRLEQVSDGVLDYQPSAPVSDLDATIYDTIPWLVTEISESYSSTVRERAVMHLRQLMYQGRSSYAAAIGKVGGILPLVNLMKEGSAEARRSAIAILYNLSMIQGNHRRILAAGAAPCLAELVRKKVPEWELALYLWQALPS